MKRENAKKKLAFLLALILLIGSLQPLSRVYASGETGNKAKESTTAESSAEIDTEDIAESTSQTEAETTEQSTETSETATSESVPNQSPTPESKPEAATSESADTEAEQEATVSEKATAPRRAEGDGSAIVEIRDLEVELFYGATWQDDPVNGGQNYIWTAGSSAAGHRFSYRIRFSISGNHELDPEKGEICEIRVPKSILRNRLGQFADDFEMSIPSWEDITYVPDESDPDRRELLPPEMLEEEVANDVDFYYVTETDEQGNEWIVIRNFRTVETGKDCYIEMNYFTDETTFSYKDMGVSDDFYATGKATSTNRETGQPVTAEAESNHIPVVINTTTSITSTEKKYPTLYRTWDSSWGTPPAELYEDTTVDDYWYLLWEIKSTISNNTTQPYNFTLDDSIIEMNAQTPDGEDIPEMQFVGYRMAGTSGFKTAAEDGNVATNQTIRGYRYDSVLTRVPKDPYADLERWEVWNGVNATVDPVDQVDADTDANSRNKFVYEIPQFRYPRGSFIQWKRADGAWRRYNPSSMYTGTSMYSPFPGLGMKGGQWSRYDLEQFIEGNLTEYGNFDYAVWIVGQPFDGNFVSDGRTDDPSAYFKDGGTVDAGGNITGYGARPVVYELIDMGSDDLHLTLYPEGAGETPDPNNSVILTSDDFAIDTLAYALQIEDARYNDASKSFSSITGTPTEDDVLTFYAKFGDSDQWVKIATRDYFNTDINNGITIIDNDHIESMTNQLITFKEGADCVAYKVVTQNAHYKCAINTVPNLHLKNSPAVMDFIRTYNENENKYVPKLESIALKNDSRGHVYGTDDYEKVLDSDTDDLNPIYTSFNYATGKNMESDSDFARITQRDSSLLKSVVSSANNTKKRYYTITWRIDEKETIIYGEPVQTEYVEQDGGTFYDLLPEGCSLDVNSVAVRTDDGFLPDGAFTVEQVANYKGTGRTLMIVRVTEPGDYYQVYFDTRHPWESIKDFGHIVYNPVAYETGNDNIAGGKPDDGGTIRDKDLMKDLTPQDDDENTFLYAERDYDITTIVAAATGLTKKVKDINDNDFSYNTFTTPEGDYIYRLRYATTSVSRAKNMVLFDSLENYITPEAYGTEESEWRGELTGVDISQLKNMGIDAKVYINTTEGLDLESYQEQGQAASDMDLDAILGGGGWTLVSEENLGNLSGTNAKAIAIDMRKKSPPDDGTEAEDFVLGNMQSVTAYLFMKGPATADFTYVDPENPDPENPEAKVKKWKNHKYPETYNNIYIYNTVIARDDGEQDFYIHQDYTIVKFLVEEDVKVKKLNAEDTTQTIPGITFRLYGTSDYGTEVDLKLTTNSRGEAIFKKVELGTYILQEYEANDDWLLDTTEHTVRIYVDTVADEVRVEIDGEDKTDIFFELTDKPRIHGDVSFRKMSIHTDAKDAVAIPNTTFRLSGTSAYGNDIVMVATSDENGDLSFKNLELGTYKLREIQANPKYILNETEYTVVIDEEGRATITNGEAPVETLQPSGRNVIRNENRYWDLDFRKVDGDAAGTPPLEGAKFRLSGVSDLGTAVEKEATSTSTGAVSFKDVEKGTYVLEEIEAPTIEKDGSTLHYVLDPVQRIVTVNDDGTFEIEGMKKAEDGGYVSEYIRSDEYVQPNKQALTGQITITKIWEDFLDDDAERPFPKIHLVTVENGVDFGVKVTKQWTNNAPENQRPNVKVRIGTRNADTGQLEEIESTVNTRWVKDDNDNWVYYFPVRQEEGVTYYVWEDETQQLKNYKVLNSETSPATVTEVNGQHVATITNEYIPPTKYAVALLGIGVDTDENGETMGLSFGPATGANYMATYKSHTPTGTTENGNAHRCVHDDDWATIIRWNTDDPWVYEQCVAEGCTHSIELTPTGTLASGTKYTATGDGASVLYSELKDDARRWKGLWNGSNYTSSYNNTGGWGATNLRAVLNGKDTSSDGTDSSTWAYREEITADNCLLTWFPEELQAAIGARATKYDSVYNQKNDANLKTTYDKLWLLSSNEIWDLQSVSNDTWYNHLREGGQYVRYDDNVNDSSPSSSGQTFIVGYRANGNNSGTSSTWWLRSSYGNYDVYALAVNNIGFVGYYHTNNSFGVSPCFALSR